MTLTNEIVKEIRDELRREFPSYKGWKFSVRKARTIDGSLEVFIKNTPVTFIEHKENKVYEEIKYTNLSQYNNIKLLRIIDNICNKFNSFDSSEIDRLDEFKVISMFSHFGLTTYCEPNYYVRIYQCFSGWNSCIGSNESYKHISNGDYNKPIFMRSNEEYNKKNPPTKDITLQEKHKLSKVLLSLNKMYNGNK